MALVPYASGELEQAMASALSTVLPMAYKDGKWAAKKIGRGLSRAYRSRKAPSMKKRVSPVNDVDRSRARRGKLRLKP